MKAFYINLARRTDRRARMERQLGALAITATRIDAVPFDHFPPDLQAHYARVSKGTRFGRNEFSNAVSHSQAHKQLLESDDRYALVLEDDVVLSPALPELLDKLDTSDQTIDVLRIETFGNPQQISRRPLRSIGAFTVHSIHGWAWGCAAYVISRRAAEKLVGHPGALESAFDRLIYRPNRTAIEPLVRGQLVPALAIQQDRLPGQVWGADSDLTATRTEMLDAGRNNLRQRLADFVENEIRIGLSSTGHRLLGLSTKRDIPFKAD